MYYAPAFFSLLALMIPPIPFVLTVSRQVVHKLISGDVPMRRERRVWKDCTGIGQYLSPAIDIVAL
jgi:hypothetical protein